MTDPMSTLTSGTVSLSTDAVVQSRTEWARPIGPRLALLAARQLQLAQEMLASPVGDLHAGIHQGRKSIRRARSALALGRRALGPGAKSLDQELGRLCRGLSRLRDAQALLEALQRLRENARPELLAILPAAEAAAGQRRDQILEQALARDPGFAARRRRLRAAALRLQRLDWASLQPVDIAKATQRGERRAGKCGRRAAQHPSDNEVWHVYRRRLRRLRQQDTLLAALQLPARADVKAMDRLTHALGEAQDNVVLLSHCAGRSPFTTAQRMLLREVARKRLREARSHWHAGHG